MGYRDPSLAIKCPDCKSTTVNDQALACYVCRRKFDPPGHMPHRFLLMAGLIGVVLAAVFVAAQQLLATR